MTKPGLFHAALERVLVHEGGKADHPKDPGGRTNKGITQRVYNGWRTKSYLPVRDVWRISDNEVEAIYRFQYWEPIRGDQLPPGVGYVIFDGAVNSGPSQSVKWTQRALGDAAGKVDGVLGSVTLTAIFSVSDHDVLIARICERRMLFLQALKTWATFKNGWTTRVTGVRNVGQAEALGTVGPRIVWVPGADAKANPSDAKKAPSTAPGDLSIGVGGAGTGGGITLDQVLDTAKDQLTPYAGVPWVKTLIVSVIVATALLAVGGFVWRWWANKEAKRLADVLDLSEGVQA